MGNIWLLVAVLQTGMPPAGVPPPLADALRPRLAAGADLGGTIVGAVGGFGGKGVGAGIRMTLPLGGGFAFDARFLHSLPAPAGGVYELRIRRSVNWRGVLKPDYAGIGAVGYYALDTGLYGRIRPRLRHVSRPLMASFTAGWENPSGRHRAMPFEISLALHPYGLFAAAATLGVTWSHAGRAPAAERRPPG